MTLRPLPSKTKTKTIIPVLGLLVFGFIPSAHAVDIENADRRPHDVTINRADGSSELLRVASGQRLENICTECVVLLGDESVEPRGSVTVEIRGGKLSLKPSR